MRLDRLRTNVSSSALLTLASIFAAVIVHVAWAGDVAGEYSKPLDRPMGYGQKTIGSGKCGDAKTCICRVVEPTRAALQACVAGDRPATVLFDGVVEINVRDRAINIGSNKTIQGPVRITGDRTLLFVDKQSNIIIRDVTFHSSLRSPRPGADCVNPTRGRDTLGCGVMIAIQGKSRDIWIDHNEFYRCGGKCITVYGFPQDGFDSEGRILGPDEITISNNIFRDSFYGVLVGLGKATPGQAPRHERVTLYGNLFTDVHQRSPAAASYVWVHVFNNLIANWGGCYNCDSLVRIDPRYLPCRGPNYGAGSSAYGEAQLFAERNHYEARPTPDSCKSAIAIDTYRNPDTGQIRGEGLVRASGNKLENGAQIVEREPLKVFDPSDPRQTDAYYPYTMLPVDSVREYVRSNAGPRKR